MFVDSEGAQNDLVDGAAMVTLACSPTRSGPGAVYAFRVLVAFPAVVDGDDIRVSATTYVTYKKCPGQADRLREFSGLTRRASFLGSLTHRMFSRHLTAGPIASDDFVRPTREEIGGSALDHKLGPLEIKPSILASVIVEVRGLYERFTRLPSEGFEGSEVSIKKEPVAGVELVGSMGRGLSGGVGRSSPGRLEDRGPG